MSEYVLTNGIVYTENEMINNGYVHIKDGKILDVGKCPFHPSSSHNTIDIIDVKKRHILPGFIDIHIHGGYGEDAMDASELGLQHLADSLLSEGTTSFLATTLSGLFKLLLNILNNKMLQMLPKLSEYILKVHLFQNIK